MLADGGQPVGIPGRRKRRQLQFRPQGSPPSGQSKVTPFACRASPKLLSPILREVTGHLALLSDQLAVDQK
eukprot:10061431-Prorocentrum_lima.AAC.1